MLSFAIANKFPILIAGAPGIGKTDIVKQAANALNAKLIVSHPVVSDPTDYKGLPFAINGKADFLPFGELQQLIEAAEPTVFMLDDLGQAPASVQAACMQLILARSINGHKVSEHVTFIAATNRKEDKAGVSGMLEPVKSRFASILELEVNSDDWTEWALDHDMPIELISYMRWQPEIISKFEATKEMRNTASPRTIANAGKLQAAGLPREFEFEAFKGAAGEAFAVGYTAFLTMYRDLPTFEEIVMNPTKAPMPESAGSLNALAGMVSSKMSEVNIDSCIKYLERTEKEIQACTITYSLRRNKDLAKTKAFIAWATKNGHILV